MFSYEMLADRLIDAANIDWNGRESQRNSCRYGMEMLISMVINFGLVLITGLLLGILKEVLIYLLAWGSLRIYSGGRHAANHRNCITLYISVMVIVIFLCRYLTARVDLRYAEIAVFTVALIINILYAGNTKSDQRIKIKNKRITLMVLLLQFVFVLIGNTVELSGDRLYQQYLVSVIAGAVLAESLFLIPFHYSNIKS